MMCACACSLCCSTAAHARDAAAAPRPKLTQPAKRNTITTISEGSSVFIGRPFEASISCGPGFANELKSGPRGGEARIRQDISLVDNVSQNLIFEDFAGTLGHRYPGLGKDHP